MGLISKQNQKCPVCGSERTNQVSTKTKFCKKCDIEFDKKGNAYSIMTDGTLVDYFVNEFMECG